MHRLILYNIEYCEGIQGKMWEYLKLWKIFMPPNNLDCDILEHLKKLEPDILGLIEVDTGSFRAKKDEVVFLKNGMEMENFIEKVKYPMTGLFSLFHHLPILKHQGNALISKYPIEDVKYHILHEGTKRVVIEATVQILKRNLKILIAHLSIGKKTRKRQIEEIKGIIQKIDEPVIVMGDFNTFEGDVEIRDLIEETKLTYAYKKTSARLNIKTHPAYNPKKLLDYVLTSEEIIVKRYKALHFILSDHLPLLVDFEFR